MRRVCEANAQRYSSTCQSRFFWGSWGASKVSPQVASRSPSILSKIVPPGVQGGKPFGVPSSNMPKGSMSMAEALDPARVSAAIDIKGGPSPDEQQQRLIDAGLQLLEQAKRVDMYSAVEIQALDEVVTLIFSETLSATMPVYEQLQLITDAIFIFSGSAHDKGIVKAFMDVLHSFVPPDVAVVFDEADIPILLRTEEERLAFLGCLRLVLGEDVEAVSVRWEGAVRAASLLIDRAAGVDVRGMAKAQFKDLTPSQHEACGARALISLNDVLHEAVAEIEQGARPDTRRLMVQLFAVLLEQLPQLTGQHVCVEFAQNAHRLRLQCEFVQLLAKLFAAFDPEETGKISFTELSESIRRVSSPENAESLLVHAHPDGDGNIDYPVLLRVIRSSQ